MPDTNEKLNLTKPSGTIDFLPEDMEKRRWVRNALERVFERYGYQEVDLPMYEFFDIYKKRSGEKVINDIFTFYDPPAHKADENPPIYALRPEFTASLARFFITSELMYRPKPQKYYYIGPCFRYDEPAPGRYRQFTQAGLEIFGPDTAAADAEMLIVAMDIMKEMEIADYLLRVNDLTFLRAYLESLVLPMETQNRVFGVIDRITSLLRKLEIGALEDDVTEDTITDDYYGSMRELDLASEVISRLENFLHLVGPAADIIAKLKTLFGDVPQVLEALENSKMLQVCPLIEAAGIANYVIDCGIARGLDYYTNLVFEIDVPLLGKQKQICGGGRYNDMIRVFGGEDTPGLGFSFGFDRIIIALEKQGTFEAKNNRSDLFIGTKPETRAYGMKIASEIRKHGISVEVDLMDRSFRAAGKFVNKMEIPFMIFLGPREQESQQFTLKDFRSEEQREGLDLGQLIKFIKPNL